MKTVTKIYLIVISILLATIVGLCFAWQYAKDEAKDAKHSLAIAEANAVAQKERETRILSELNEKHAENILVMSQELALKEIEHKEKLHALEVRYTAATTTNQQLLDKVRLLNGELSRLSRAAVENYATTASNNLGECSTATVEMEYVALGYNEELEYYRGIWKQYQEQLERAGITVYDEKSGLMKTHYQPIRLKGDVETIEVVSP